MTRVLELDPEHPDLQLVGEAARALLGGALVAFPTETVYGLGAHALDADAVARLFRAKGRPATDPVIVHLAEAERLIEIAQDIPAEMRALAQAFWPGALTVVLRKRPSIPDAITAGQSTVAVRVPAHPIAHLLLQHADVPVAAPSANLFSRPSPTSAAHVLADLDGVIDMLLDGGSTTIGIESTILDLTVSPPLVRRPGGVAVEEIRRILPETLTVAEVYGSTTPQPAPGQLIRHYAPRATLTLYVGDPAQLVQQIASDARSAAASGLRVGILAPEEDLLALAPRLAAVAATGRIVTRRYGSRRNRVAAARELFSAMRSLDMEEVNVILASATEAADLGLAMIDRLTRAAEGRVVIV